MYVYKHINIQKVYMYINTEYEGSIDIDKGKHFSFVAEILVMLEVTYSLSNSPIKQLHAASPLQAQYE